MRFLVMVIMSLCMASYSHARIASYFEANSLVDPFGEIVKCNLVDLQYVERQKEESFVLKVQLSPSVSAATNVIRRFYYPYKDLPMRLFDNVESNVRFSKVEKLPARIGFLEVSQQNFLPLGNALNIASLAKADDLALEIVDDKEVRRREREGLEYLKMPRWPMIYKGYPNFNSGLNYLDYPSRKDIGVSYAFYRSLDNGRFSLLAVVFSSDGKIIDLVEHSGQVDFSRLEIAKSNTNVICGTNRMVMKSWIAHKTDEYSRLVLEIHADKFFRVVNVDMNRQGWK